MQAVALSSHNTLTPLPLVATLQAVGYAIPAHECCSLRTSNGLDIATLVQAVSRLLESAGRFFMSSDTADAIILEAKQNEKSKHQHLQTPESVTLAANVLHLVSDVYGRLQSPHNLEKSAIETIQKWARAVTEAIVSLFLKDNVIQVCMGCMSTVCDALVLTLRCIKGDFDFAMLNIGWKGIVKLISRYHCDAFIESFNMEICMDAINNSLQENFSAMMTASIEDSSLGFKRSLTVVRFFVHNLSQMCRHFSDIALAGNAGTLAKLRKTMLWRLLAIWTAINQQFIIHQILQEEKWEADTQKTSCLQYLIIPLQTMIFDMLSNASKLFQDPGFAYELTAVFGNRKDLAKPIPFSTITSAPLACLWFLGLLCKRFTSLDSSLQSHLMMSPSSCGSMEEKDDRHSLLLPKTLLSAIQLIDGCPLVIHAPLLLELQCSPSTQPAFPTTLHSELTHSLFEILHRYFYNQRKEIEKLLCSGCLGGYGTGCSQTIAEETFAQLCAVRDGAMAANHIHMAIQLLSKLDPSLVVHELATNLISRLSRVIKSDQETDIVNRIINSDLDLVNLGSVLHGFPTDGLSLNAKKQICNYAARRILDEYSHISMVDAYLTTLIGSLSDALEGSDSAPEALLETNLRARIVKMVVSFFCCHAVTASETERLLRSEMTRLAARVLRYTSHEDILMILQTLVQWTNSNMLYEQAVARFLGECGLVPFSMNLKQPLAHVLESLFKRTLLSKNPLVHQEALDAVIRFARFTGFPELFELVVPKHLQPIVVQYISQKPQFKAIDAAGSVQLLKNSSSDVAMLSNANAVVLKSLFKLNEMRITSVALPPAVQRSIDTLRLFIQDPAKMTAEQRSMVTEAMRGMMQI